MDHIRLSPRLQTVADFVPPCTCAADIGTDHGYLPVWLLQNGIAETAIAADIHAGPLANARQSAHAYDLTERFRFVLADGLQFPDAKDADVITIAGMGGETICAIMAAASWLQEGLRLVLQPQSKVAELTDWLWRSGFTIEDAALCRDSGKRYLALRPEYLTDEIRRQTRARAGMAHAKQTPEAALAALDARLNELQTCLKEVKSWQP